MTTFAVSMVKDEADVIAGTVLHMADEVDHLIVADNGSTDGTREILAELEDRLPLTVLDDPEPAYYQSRKMSALAEAAYDQGAEWVVPFDADELWFGHADRISVVLKDLDTTSAVTAELFNHFPSAVDPAEADPFASIVWRQPKPAPLAKVAFRCRTSVKLGYRPIVEQGNHGVHYLKPDGSDKWWPATVPMLEVRHFPYRSAEQFVRKARNGAAAYAKTDLPANVGAHWRQYGTLLERFGEDALHDVWRTHFWFLAPADAGLVPDPAPYRRWQSAS